MNMSCDATPDLAWCAGVARVSITPDEPMWMHGWSRREQPFRRVAQPIWAKALALRDARGHADAEALESPVDTSWASLN